MKSALSGEVKEVMQAVHYRPAIFVILPFEPKMNLKSELSRQLKFATDKIEKELKKNYPGEVYKPVLEKWTAIMNGLNYNTHKKSIAIYVSPVFEKVIYADIPVTERIIIDESFEIRDLVFAKKEMDKYLLLVLSGKNCKMFIGDAVSLTKVKTNMPDHIAAFETDPPGRVANFSDPSGYKETIQKKFLHETDTGLGHLLKIYPLPVFVMATSKLGGYFKTLTKHSKNIIGYIHGNYQEATAHELKEIVQPCLQDWKTVKTTSLLGEIEHAADAGKLASGIENVWENATEQRGRLLIVEKDYTCAANYGKDRGTIVRTGETDDKDPYLRDAVDQVIEKVLETGGDVEFVDNGVLKDHGHIVLVQYY